MAAVTCDRRNPPDSFDCARRFAYTFGAARLPRSHITRRQNDANLLRLRFVQLELNSIDTRWWHHLGADSNSAFSDGLLRPVETAKTSLYNPSQLVHIFQVLVEVLPSVHRIDELC